MAKYRICLWDACIPSCVGKCPCDILSSPLSDHSCLFICFICSCLQFACVSCSTLTTSPCLSSPEFQLSSPSPTSSLLTTSLPKQFGSLRIISCQLILSAICLVVSIHDCGCEINLTCMWQDKLSFVQLFLLQLFPLLSFYLYHISLGNHSSPSISLHSYLILFLPISIISKYLVRCTMHGTVWHK